MIRLATLSCRVVSEVFNFTNHFGSSSKLKFLTFCQLHRVFWPVTTSSLVPKYLDSNCGDENVHVFVISFLIEIVFEPTDGSAGGGDMSVKLEKSTQREL